MIDNNLPGDGGDVPEVFRRVWPDGLPTSELAFWASLSPTERDDLTKRFAAVVAADVPGTDLAELARDLGMGRTGFYSLRTRWADQRTLRAVARFATRSARRIPTTVGPAEAEAADGEAAAGAAAPSKPTARRLARERARDAARDPEALRRGFGRAFVLDVTPVDLVAPGGGDPEWLVCAFLIERFSGLILAAAPGSAGVSPRLADVAREGAERALELRLSVRKPSLTVVVPDPREGEFLTMTRMRAHLAEVLGEASVRWSEPRRFGSALVEAVGERVGGLDLRRRADWRKPIAHDVLAKAAVPSASEVDVLLRTEVRRSNELLERRLRRLGLIGGAGDPAPLVGLLDAAFPEEAP